MYKYTTTHRFMFKSSLFRAQNHKHCCLRGVYKLSRDRSDLRPWNRVRQNVKKRFRKKEGISKRESQMRDPTGAVGSTENIRISLAVIYMLIIVGDIGVGG